jgi:hypothetical protein
MKATISLVRALPLFGLLSASCGGGENAPAVDASAAWCTRDRAAECGDMCDNVVLVQHRLHFIKAEVIEGACPPPTCTDDLSRDCGAVQFGCSARALPDPETNGSSVCRYRLSSKEGETLDVLIQQAKAPSPEKHCCCENENGPTCGAPVVRTTGRNVWTTWVNGVLITPDHLWPIGDISDVVSPPDAGVTKDASSH